MALFEKRAIASRFITGFTEANQAGMFTVFAGDTVPRGLDAGPVLRGISMESAHIANIGVFGW